MPQIDLVEGDTLPWLTGTITDDDGAVVDVTGWAITLHIGYEPPLVKAATIPTGTDGLYQFAWIAGDLRPGKWPAEVQVVTQIGVQTFQHTQAGDKLFLNISRQIA